MVLCGFFHGWLAGDGGWRWNWCDAAPDWRRVWKSIAANWTTFECTGKLVGKAELEQSITIIFCYIYGDVIVNERSRELLQQWFYWLAMPILVVNFLCMDIYLMIWTCVLILTWRSILISCIRFCFFFFGHLMFC